MERDGMCVYEDTSGNTTPIEPQPTPTTTMSHLFSGSASTPDTAINNPTPSSDPATPSSSSSGSGGSGGGGGGGGGGSNFGITCDKFNKAVVDGGNAIGQRYPTPSSSQCSSFLNGMVSKGHIANAREAAMFLSNILWESDGLRAKEEYDCKSLPDWCAQNYKTPSDVPGQTYWGRGYIQLSWHYNYLDASKGLFGDDRLTKNTAQVASNEDLAWGVSFWFWSDRVRSDPGVQAGKFGASINKINGGLECNGGAAADKARKRYAMYKVILPLFAPGETPIESGCYN
ncbi:lysozyme-like protein [Linderina pennispora]|uniref:Lysozyme-like protein n=1 Tax=Linderina pennispora TaxID=61395 RepID=A0A1Y1W8I8_9FUNG|nr:lysozyme-like protein [Linderina pennispora]ORX69860.1 lysozyme-like protein [Linderina pennispora]